MAYLKFNRKGALGEFVLYVPFLVLWFLIFAGIVGGVYAFYGKGYDSRTDEAGLLYDKVKKCSEKNGIDAFLVNETAFYELCSINQKIIEDGEHLVYLKKENTEEEFFKGVYDFKNRCFFPKADKNRDLPRCENRVIKIKGESFELIAASSQNSRGLLT